MKLRKVSFKLKVISELTTMVDSSLAFNLWCSNRFMHINKDDYIVNELRRICG